MSLDLFRRKKREKPVEIVGVRDPAEKGATPVRPTVESTAPAASTPVAPVPPPPPRTGPGAESPGRAGAPATAEAETRLSPRKATRQGPQLFSIVLDCSGSMRDANAAKRGTGKAENASTVVREAIERGNSFNRYFDSERQSQGESYCGLQIIQFADKVLDVTRGMVNPSTLRADDARFGVPADDKVVGTMTDLAGALAAAHATLERQLTEARRKLPMPAPVVLVISDGMPNVPDAVQGRQRSLEWAAKLQQLVLPEVVVENPRYNRYQRYAAAAVKVVAIGIGDRGDIDPGFLQELASESTTPSGERVRLYLHQPQPELMKLVGTQIVGSVTQTPLDPHSKTLEEILLEAQKNPPQP